MWGWSEKRRLIEASEVVLSVVRGFVPTQVNRLVFTYDVISMDAGKSAGDTAATSEPKDSAYKKLLTDFDGNGENEPRFDKWGFVVKGGREQAKCDE